jgi:hypothetical protein
MFVVHETLLNKKNEKNIEMPFMAVVFSQRIFIIKKCKKHYLNEISSNFFFFLEWS